MILTPIDESNRNAQWFAIIFRGNLQQKRDGDLGPLGGVGIPLGPRAEAALQHVGVDDARIERNRGHAVWQLLGECPRQSLDGPLCRAVRSHFC